jgi:threonine aldolase
MEAALFCPSGTMTNQIAIRLHTGPQKEVICHQYSHIYLYEGGGIMANSMASVKLLTGDLGKITASQVAESINPDDVHAPETTLVSLENTMNKGGGSIYTLDEVRPIQALCQEKGLKLHLDGARLFNALVETGESPADWGAKFDTISICLSKGLGCPIGSVLLGTKADIKRAKKVRKVFGGGMRQAGFIAAGGLYALKNNVERLKIDHINAQAIESELQKCTWVKEVVPVETNIVVAILNEPTKRDTIIELLKTEGIKTIPFGEGMIRFVTHLNVDQQKIDYTIEKLGKLIIS